MARTTIAAVTRAYSIKWMGLFLHIFASNNRILNLNSNGEIFVVERLMDLFIKKRKFGARIKLFSSKFQWNVLEIISGHVCEIKFMRYIYSVN